MNKSELIAALRRVSNGDLSDIEETSAGLCFNLFWRNEFLTHDYMVEIMSRWPEARKSRDGHTYNYPVEGSTYMYKRVKNKYKGKTGGRRMRLAAFIADELEKIE